MSTKQNILQIQENISQALKRKHSENFAGLEEVRIIAVTKNQPVTKITEAMDAGIDIVGENRVQEARGKYEQMADAAKLRWHLVGHLQTNKVRQAVELFDLIHSVDSERLAEAVNNAAAKINKRQDVLIQINVGGEDSKFGIAPSFEKTAALAAFIGRLKNVRLCGLMTVAPFYDNPEETRPVFREMKRLFDELILLNVPDTDVRWLSMGMTHDYAVAIEEGANMVRIGTGIFGARQYD